MLSVGISMKITALRFVELCGRAHFDCLVHNEPIGKPSDIYPHCRGAGRRRAAGASGPWSINVRQLWLCVETDGGITGQFGPVNADVARLVCSRMGQCLIGQDPLANEMLWDVMYRRQSHCQDLMMHAIAAVDCCLWDIKGKHFNVPAHVLLGGPTRKQIPTYAQAKGLSQHPEHLLPQAKAIVDAGWRRLKVFFNHGPADGAQGMARNVELIRTLREGLGDEVELMADAWRSWDYHYALAMMPRLEPYNLAWLEEPLLPELAHASSRLLRRFSIPIACGEHAYTRWQHRSLLEAQAADILQPDVSWAGGMTEMLKILAVASTAGVPIVPHANVLQPTVYFMAAVSPGAATMMEYPVHEDTFSAAFFLKDRPAAAAGEIQVPSAVGCGMEWDESRIESQRELLDFELRT